MRRSITVLAALALVVAPLPLATLFEGATASPAPLENTRDPTLDPLEEATVVRDDFGVAHIYADSERPLWYANGYVQAQDRLWAMDLLRHLSYGEGASVVGPGGGILEMDLNTRRNLYNASMLQQQLEDADPIFVERVEHFTDGVNRAAAEMQATGEMPAEFPALQHAFEPWEPIDTLAVATFLLAEFGNGGGAEVANAQLLRQLESELGPSQAKIAFDDLVWGEHPDSYATIQETTYEKSPHGIPDLSSLTPEQQAATEAAKDAEAFGLDTEPLIGLETSSPTGEGLEATGLPDVGFFAGEDIGSDDFRLGSNALLIAPSLSETGEAMVGGGPQMGYFNPQIPYEVGLHSEEEGIEAEGMGVTGAPGVIIGRTDDFAWTVTSGISDQTDMVALPAAEDGNRSYTWDGQTRQLDCRDETHRIFSPPALWGPATASDPANASLPIDVVTQEVCRADLSPTGEDPEKTYPVTAITTDASGEAAWFFAAKTSSRMQEVDSAIKWLSLDEADDYGEFQERFEGFAFTFNFHFAGIDRAEDGTTTEKACYVHVGRQPVRADALDPRLPTPAGDDWQWGPDDQPEYLTGDDLPRACNPDKGYFAQWNNKPQDGWASGDSRELWGSIHRVERLDQELHEALDEDDDGKLTLDQVQAILKDAATEDSLAGQIVPLFTGEAGNQQQSYASATPDVAQDALAAWAEGGADSDYPWRAGTPETPPDEARVSNHSDDDFADGENDLVYVDPGHTVYDEVMPILLERIFGDELGEHVRGVNLDPRNSSDPHAGDHGQHNNPFAIIVDVLEGTTDRQWCDDVTTAPTESCNAQVAAAFADAGFDELASTDEIELTTQHKSPFTSLGVGPSYEIPMTNRATFYHFHVGSDVGSSTALLPAGASGHMSVVDFAVFSATGEQPEHMNDQLLPYVDFEPKQLPWSQERAEEGADSSKALLVPPPLR